MNELLTGIKGILKASILPLSDDKRIELVKELVSVLTSLLVELEKVVKPTITQEASVEPKLSYAEKKVNGTIGTITGKVANKQTLEAFVDVATDKKVVTETVITKKPTGEVKRVDPPKTETVDPSGFGTQKKRFFFGGRDGKSLASYMYFVNGKKTSLTEFSKIILPLVKGEIERLVTANKPHYGVELYRQYWSKGDYAVPRQWVRSQINPQVATWAKVVNGIHFEVKQAPTK